METQDLAAAVKSNTITVVVKPGSSRTELVGYDSEKKGVGSKGSSCCRNPSRSKFDWAQSPKGDLGG